jgi:hypothetical protein
MPFFLYETLRKATSRRSEFLTSDISESEIVDPKIWRNN